MWSTGWDNTYSGPICAGLDQLTDHNRPLLALSLARCDLWTDWQTGAGQLFYDLSQEVSKISEISQRPISLGWRVIVESQANYFQFLHASQISNIKFILLRNLFTAKLMKIREVQEAMVTRWTERGGFFANFLPSLVLSQGLFNRKFTSIRRVTFQIGPSFVL